jgi:rubrerythrin
MLKLLHQAEAADELGVFDHLLAKVDDPELNRVVRRHKSDEERHAQIFKERLDAQAVPAHEVPDPAPVIPFIDHALGGFAAKFVGDHHSVMEAYLLLQVIEERGAAQYPMFADALEPYDPESARVIRQVAADEERHIKYAVAISRRYASGFEAREQALERIRKAEDKGYRAHGDAFIVQAVDENLLAVGGLERYFWKGLAAMSRPRQLAPAMSGAR